MRATCPVYLVHRLNAQRRISVASRRKNCAQRGSRDHKTERHISVISERISIKFCISGLDYQKLTVELNFGSYRTKITRILHGAQKEKCLLKNKDRSRKIPFVVSHVYAKYSTFSREFKGEVCSRQTFLISYETWCLAYKWTSFMSRYGEACTSYDEPTYVRSFSTLLFVSPILHWLLGDHKTVLLDRSTFTDVSSLGYDAQNWLTGVSSHNILTL